MGELFNLEDLDIEGCILVQRLPSSLGRLTKLSTLRIGRTEIGGLPKDLGQLCCLKTSKASNCKSLVELPESIGELSNLEDLDIYGCILVQRLLLSLERLTKLSTLRTRGTKI